MGEQDTTRGGRRVRAKDLLRLLLAVITAVAVVKELRTPAAQRTWHGTIAGAIPYDFRKPTLERARAVYWDPEGPLVSTRLWGVGWAPNVGAITHRVRELIATRR